MSIYGLVSVFDKQNVVRISKFLSDKGLNLLSSTGTARLLKENSIDITEISDYTGSPEILGGRVKTLHPKIYGGILQNTHNKEHVLEMKNAKVSPISVVISNLYPFEQKNCIENIDIGGVTLIRAAAKNYESVLVIVDPNDYPRIMSTFDEIMANNDNGINFRKWYARKAFHYVTNYDIAIANFFEDDMFHMTHGSGMRETFYRTYEKKLDLKYGCNPHQNKAAVYDIKKPLQPKSLPFKIENGKPGYINILDALYSWQLVNEVYDTLGLTCAASFKHNAPAGVGTSIPLSVELKEVYDIDKNKKLTPCSTAFIRARNCDPLSSFGDFIAINEIVDLETAQLIKKEVSDGIIAGGYTEEALKLLSTKKNGNYIILTGENTKTTEPKKSDKKAQDVEFKEVDGCAVMQSVNREKVDERYFEHRVTKNVKISSENRIDLTLANITLKYTPSNSVAAAFDGQVIGIGAGQQNRVDCVKIVQKKVNTWYLRQHSKTMEYFNKLKEQGVKRQDRVNRIINFIETDDDICKERENYINAISKNKNMVLASDAFFPFPDSIDVAAKMGVTHVMQTGGSIMDGKVTEAADKYGMCMVLSHIRVFTH